MTFGLSMDYEIFLLTRIRERFLQTNNTRDAVAYGVSTSARTHHQRRADHDRGVHRVRVRGHAAGGASWACACAVAIAVDATVVRLVLGARADGDVRRMELVAAALAGPHPAVGRTSRSRCRRPTSAIWSSSRTTSRRCRAWRRCAHGGQVRGASSKPCAPDDYRRRSAGARQSHQLRKSAGARSANAHVNGARTATARRTARRTGRAKRDRLPGRHPITMWRAGCRVALDALVTEADYERPPVERQSPVETTNDPSCRPVIGCRSLPARRRCG